MKMTILFSTATILLGLGLVAWNFYSGVSTYPSTTEQSNVDFYSLSCNTLEGEEFSFEQLRGKTSEKSP